MGNVIGKIPDFTSDDSVSKPENRNEEVVEEVKEAGVEETSEPEKETTPTEPPAVEKPLEPETAKPDDGIQNTEKAILGLRDEREKLLKEIVELKGKRREIKQEALIKVQEKIDDLKDVSPDDVNLINKVLQAKGYVTKEETDKMFYDSVKNETLNKFLEKYPEYKPENDSNDIHWGALQRELGYYRMPEDPHKIIEVLEKAHKLIAGSVSVDRSVSVKKRQIEVASVGSGGTQRSSSVKNLDSHKRLMLEQGGWSKEEIDRIEKGL